MKRICVLAMVCVLAVMNVATADTIRGINIDFVTIGHAGNAADTGGTLGCGAIGYNYRIGKYEVTNAQWNAFTAVAGAPAGNARDGTSSSAYDQSALYADPQQPTNNVSWYEAAQFCNWLTSGDKSKGVYQFSGDNANPGDFLGINRDAAKATYGTIYFLPTENEWYKAAYYKPDGSGYSVYANGSGEIPAADNGWNTGGGSYSTPWNVSTGTQEQNGTFDMMGNVWEWSETLINSSNCVIRGSTFNNSARETVMSSQRLYFEPAREEEGVGFRVASTIPIPKPTTVAGAIVGWGQDSLGTGYTVSTIPAGTDFVAIAAGHEHGSALRSDGSIVSWGSNLEGQVSNTPIGTGFTAIAAGKMHGLALRENGSLVTWGFNGYGEVSNTPTGNDFIAISGSLSHHLMALRNDGSIVSWGYDIVNLVSDTPTGSGYIDIAGGLAHSLALHSNGSIVGWGQNALGILSNIPVGNDFVAIATGGYHGLALKNDGSIVSWGNNSDGQVSYTPIGTDFVAIAAGEDSSLAIRRDGSIAYWGKNNYYQRENTPIGTNYIAVAGSDNFSLALTSEPTLLLHGPNGSENIGAGTIHTITWSSTGSIGNVHIEFSTNDGGTWNDVNTLPNSGSYNWLVPAVNSNQCLVRISDAAQPAIYDISNNIFTITQGNPSKYPTLHQLLGGSAPAIAESGRDFVARSIPDINVVAFILLEDAGYANENVFGIYSASDPQQKLQLFSGADFPTDMTIVQFDAAAGTAKNLQTGQTANIDKYFGFYLTTPQNGGTTYYTDLTRNPDSLEHGLIYNTSGFAGVIENDPDTVIAFEDLLGLGDKDYNDMVVGITNAVPLAGSTPYCIKVIPGDLNGDCKVNLVDFAVIAAHWCECNLDPQSACGG